MIMNSSAETCYVRFIAEMLTVDDCFALYEYTEFFVILCYCPMLVTSVHNYPYFIQATTCLGQKIADVAINENVVSEILRIFIIARNGKPNEVNTVVSQQKFICCSLLLQQLAANMVQ